MKSLITSALMILALMLPTTATAYDFMVDSIYYNITGTHTVEVTYEREYWDDYSGDVAIPATVTHSGIVYDVKSIGYKAFAYCSGLSSVTIPNSVTSIGQRAFWNCRGLTSMTIPRFVSFIGMGAFADCANLTSLEVEDGNTTYDSRDHCNAIIETASNTLIAGCQNAVIPTSVTSIGDDAFYYCSGLASVMIPNSVTSIGKNAFSHCGGLRGVTIPNSVTAIGEYAFAYCRGIDSLTISTSVTAIGKSVFSHCAGLTSVTIPNSVTTIGDEAFFSCSGLTSVTIPNSVTSIGNFAFTDCISLTDVYCYITDLSTVKNGYSVFEVWTEDGNYDYSGRTLHVPQRTAGQYKTNEYWYPYFGPIVDELIIEDYLRGDVNQDGAVNIADVNVVIDIILGAVLDAETMLRADVNEDSSINISDVNEIINIILNPVEVEEHEWVDLGLPSGTLWATCNIGASAPEQYGDYFAWGETEPKDYYYWETYKWCEGSENTLTKYCTDSEYGTVDGKTVLDPQDDAAFVNWGPSWRMPTLEQQLELLEKCTWQWTTRDDVNGLLVTGPNGNSIFLPAAGEGFLHVHADVGRWGEYWSREGTTLADGICFDSEGIYMFSGVRVFGRSVRAVYTP